MGLDHLLPLVALFFASAVPHAGSASLVAVVPDSAAAELKAKVTTPWQFVSAASASADELEKAVVVVPDFGMIRSASTMSAVLQRIPAGTLLQLPMTGTDTLDLASIPSRFSVCNVHNAGTAIPEYVLAAVMSWNVQLPKLSADFRSCAWHAGNKSVCQRPPMHKETKGQTMGVVGYGTIGQGVVQRAAAMGMRVVAIDSSPHSSTPPPLAWIGNDTMLPRLMEEADFVVISVPLLPATRGMINADILSHMKSSGVLVNIARGPIVDEFALYSVLKEGKIGGAVIDVWWQEMDPDAWPSRFDFSAMPNVWMTLHTSFNTLEAHEEGTRQIAANLDLFATGKPLQHIVRGPSGLSSGDSISI